jgi:hypothetical protein
MLKRCIPLLVLCALALGAGQALAVQYAGTHGTTINVKFRSHRNDATLNLTQQQIADGFVDSTYKTTQGKGVIAGAATGSIADTTAPFSLLSLVPSQQGATTAANDSVAWFRVSFTPGPDCAAAATIDSLYLLAQVSADGNTWESVSIVKDLAYANYQTAASTLTSTTPMVRMANGTATVLFHTSIASRWLADIPSIGTWPMARFLLIHDISASGTAAKHQFKCVVNGWSAAVDAN